MYHRDNTTNRGGTITVTGRPSGTDETCWITPTTNIVGDLEWLDTRAFCDVAIVYDSSAANAIIDIFITSDPDNTPSDPGTLNYRPTVDYNNGTTAYELTVARRLG